TSGVASYKLVYATGAGPATCNAGTVLYAGSARTASHASAVNGMLYYYRLCAIDNAGNMNTGVTASAKPAPESDAPVGTVIIQGGAQYSKTSAVSLAISATDASGVTTMCVSNTPSCSTYVAYTTTRTWTLATNNTVYV